MSVLDDLRGSLIVSVQAEATSLLNVPETIALLARCAVQNGAAGVRIEGLERIRAVRAALDVPIVGLVKRADAQFAPYITPSAEDARAIAEAGAQIVAFDATMRPRKGGASVAGLISAIHTRGALAMADCSSLEDGRQASEAGADIVATTLAGYTAETSWLALPALDLVAGLAALHPFAVCEGGIANPEAARAAFEAGASAIVVGTAITNVDALVRRFALIAPRSTST
jgi:N-acylglucosamine-6-phosphate 2-epimerase